jgi:hypothetical protein
MLCLRLSVRDLATCLPTSQNDVGRPNMMLVDGPVSSIQSAVAAWPFCCSKPSDPPRAVAMAIAIVAPGQLCIPWIAFSRSRERLICCYLIALSCSCPGVPVLETVPRRGLRPSFRMIAVFRSSSDVNAVSWNWNICSTIAEISFDPAVIPRSRYRIPQYIDQAGRCTDAVRPIHCCVLRSIPLGAVRSGRISNRIAFAGQDPPLPGIQRHILGGSPQQLYVIC